MPLAKNQMIQLTVDSLSSDGNGVGRHDGQAVFVPAAATGDVLQVRIVKPAKTYAYGRIEQIVTPGAGRQKSNCPVSAVCGGCCFRHMEYACELVAKQGFVQDALRRIGKLDADVLPILPSPKEERYRNKVQYPVMQDEKNELVYGFYASRSHRVVACEDCRLQPELLNRIAARTAELLREINAPAYDESTQTGVIRHIYLRVGHHTGEVMLCLVCRAPTLRGADLLAKTITTEFPQIKTVILNVNPDNTNVICGRKNVSLFGLGHIRETICGVPLRLDPFSFSQVNTPGAERLFGIVQQFAAPSATDILLDLYCGTGVIGLSMVQHCRELIGVEIVPSAVENANQSAKEMGASKKCRFFCEAAAAAATRLQQEGLRPDIVTLDPPRKGCDETTLRALLSMAPSRIVMVSCNPATLARDLSFLSENGYTLRKIQPVDLFPRTKHVECVTLLERDNS